MMLSPGTAGQCFDAVYYGINLRKSNRIKWLPVYELILNLTTLKLQLYHILTTKMWFSCG